MRSGAQRRHHDLLGRGSVAGEAPSLTLGRPPCPALLNQTSKMVLELSPYVREAALQCPFKPA